MKALEQIKRYVGQVRGARGLRIRRIDDRTPGAGFCSGSRRWRAPMDQPLTTLQTDLQGPVAHSITTAAIIGAGLTWAFSEHGTGARKMSALAFGGAAALGATQLMTAVFPFAGALF